jgi:ABC-type thiamin/hydroxymethylpyrimidine transport system permease subunit
MSFLEFMLLMAAYLVQGLIFPLGLLVYLRYKCKSAVIMMLGSVCMFISSFALTMLRPNVTGKLKMSDFHNGYVALTSQMQPMYFVLAAGMLAVVLASIIMSVEALNRYRTNKENYK